MKKYREGKVKQIRGDEIFLKFNADKQLKLFKATTYLLHNGPTSLFLWRA